MHKINYYFEENNGNKYLILASNDGHQDTLNMSRNMEKNQEILSELIGSIITLKIMMKNI